MNAAKPKVGLISLGCPKNLVDSEVMLGILQKEGYEFTKNEQEAQVMIVNTCAFIEASKTESVNTILDVARLKTEGSLKKLVVTGCLAQRYKDDLEKEMPEVDHFIGTGEFQKIAQFTKIENQLPVVRSVVDRPEFIYDYATPRISTLPKHTVYVKIAEGCSRTCSFCIIPRLRGRGRSRPIDSIVKEVQQHAERGALEVNLIAQDLTAYGLDIEDGTTLEKLLRKLVKVEGIRWIRLMYNYPMYFTKSLIDLIASSDKICNYLDIPLQHIDSELLATMKRKVDEKEVRDLVKELRGSIPNLTLRTTLIVGFPGETDEQFKKLYDFVEETEFDRLGVFTYSQEEGTLAAKMSGQVNDKIKKKRRDQIMRMQQKISDKRNKLMVGKEIDVLIDRQIEGQIGYSYLARTEGQALDIDGNVLLTGRNLPIGSFVRAKIQKSAEYDLFATAL